LRCEKASPSAPESAIFSIVSVLRHCTFAPTQH
jgi:hypothetical protein